MKDPVHVEGLTDSDGYPVSPWSSRFVEVETFDDAAEDSVREFTRAIAKGFDRMIEAYRLAAEQIAAFAEIFFSDRDSARRVVQAQRRRRHR